MTSRHRGQGIAASAQATATYLEESDFWPLIESSNSSGISFRKLDRHVSSMTVYATDIDIIPFFKAGNARVVSSQTLPVLQCFLSSCSLIRSC